MMKKMEKGRASIYICITWELEFIWRRSWKAITPKWIEAVNQGLPPDTQLSLSRIAVAHPHLIISPYHHFPPRGRTITISSLLFFLLSSFTTSNPFSLTINLSLSILFFLSNKLHNQSINASFFMRILLYCIFSLSQFFL